MSGFYVRQRGIAAELLNDLAEKVLKKRLPLDRELHSVFRRNKGWGSKDRRFYSETVFGFFRWYGWINRCFSSSVAQWSLEEWGAVVDLVQELNASTDTSEALSFVTNKFPKVNFSKIMLVPDTVKELYCDSADSFEAFVEAQQLRPPVWLRCRNEVAVKQLISELDKNDRIDYQIHESCKLAVKVVGRFNINELKTFQNGAVEIQDFASQCIGLVASPKAGEFWLDTCAGAGGKTLQLAAMMKDKGRIIACDIRDSALKELKKRSTKSGSRSISIKNNDFLNCTSKFHDTLFDGILVDAPCSNSGTWRRNPALRWSFSQKKSELAADIQLKILENAAGHVKPGGVLVYSTCSASILENQGVVKQFLLNNPHFSGADFKNPVTGESCNASLFLPFDLADNDTMFVAKLRRDC